MMRRVFSACVAPATLKLCSMRHQTVPPRRNLAVYDNFLTGASTAYIEQMYHSWKSDPASVDPSWSEIFEKALEFDFDEGLLKEHRRVVSGSMQNTFAQTLADCTRLAWMIDAFESKGHIMASVDPLNFVDDPSKRSPTRQLQSALRLDLAYFGFTPADHDRKVHVGFLESIGGVFSTADSKPMTIKQLHEHLVSVYCGNVGYEFSHIRDEEIMCYMRNHIESPNVNSHLRTVFTPVEKKEFLRTIGEAVMFEDLLARKYSTKKRFGLDGGEGFVLALHALLERAAHNGVEEAICGMAHRGRLNSLTHIFGKPLRATLKEFKGIKQEELLPYTIQSDVKYHLGSRTVRTFGRCPNPITVELLSNPSHLEAVNPVVQGKTKASQVARGDNDGSKVMPIEIHGDAAFSGQGIAFETMGMSEIGKYHTGGTIHIVINNQIGFTTDPKSSRSSAHCTDLGRIYNCPIMHVNGDRPEDVVRVMRFAADYRAKFNRSIVVDLVCYRRNGHNESDVPSLTQPLMYKRIGAQPDIFTLYGKALIDEGVISEADYNNLKKDLKVPLNTAFDDVDSNDYNYSEYMKSCVPEGWKDMALSDGAPALYPTAVERSALEPVIKALNTYPQDFAVHPTLQKIIARRHQNFVDGKGIDWGAAEALAFGTLLQEGYHVHVSGQDVERATFSQRHAVLHDQNNNNKYTHLEHISRGQARFTITNSSLSEYGVLGFEVGYSMHSPKALCIWEAQFGDFANGAQIIFDQFLSSGETKWNTMYAPVVSMPHGYDGMGPEHSSGRIERFLQLVAEDEASTTPLSIAERLHKNNMEVTFPSTPAQYFHLLRRHVKRNFRKPLINFFSKGFLREVDGCANTSTIDEFTGNTRFLELIPDAVVTPDKARRVVLCTGQLYHKLYKTRSKLELQDVALVRIEQLAPFPLAEVIELLKDYPTQELVWAQEEPQNMGAWWYVDARFDSITQGARPLRYAGRDPSSSPATGYKYAHDYEQDLIFKACFE